MINKNSRKAQSNFDIAAIGDSAEAPVVPARRCRSASSIMSGPIFGPKTLNGDEPLTGTASGSNKQQQQQGEGAGVSNLSSKQQFELHFHKLLLTTVNQISKSANKAYENATAGLSEADLVEPPLVPTFEIGDVCKSMDTVLDTCRKLLKAEAPNLPKWMVFDTTESYKYVEEMDLKFFNYHFEGLLSNPPDLEVLSSLLNSLNYHVVYEEESYLHILNSNPLLEMEVHVRGQVICDCPSSEIANTAVDQLNGLLGEGGCQSSISPTFRSKVRATFTLHHEVNLALMCDRYPDNTYYKPTEHPHLVFHLPVDNCIFVVLSRGVVLVLNADHRSLLKQSIEFMLRVLFTCRDKPKTMDEETVRDDGRYLRMWRQRLDEDKSSSVLFAKGG